MSELVYVVDNNHWDGTCFRMTSEEFARWKHESEETGESPYRLTPDEVHETYIVVGGLRIDFGFSL